MAIIVLIGRILFVSLFIGGGINHFRNTAAMSGYAQSKGVPFARVGVLGSGAMILVGGLMVLLGAWADLGALLLVVFLLGTAVMMHDFWKQTDPMGKMNDLINFQKNVSLAGAGLALFAFFAYVGDDLGLTLTGPLFHLG
jgi:putative oxidoreductase